MNYQSALKYLKSTEGKGSILGLSTTETLLYYLGNPEKTLNIIHIGGTNGKGSTASYITQGLRASSYSVGLFTSPYLSSPLEMIEINNVSISEESFSRGITEIADAVHQMESSGHPSPTEFETMVALSYWYFARSEVDFAVVEVGLGGREDATNVITKPLLSVFSAISLDHTDLLGNTLESIAEIKSGIIKEGCPVLSAPQDPSVERLLRQKSEAENAPFYSINESSIRALSSSSSGQSFMLSSSIELPTPFFDDRAIQLSMLGSHQAVNASLALHALALLSEHHGVSLDAEGILAACSTHQWQGRFERIGSSPDIIIDGAHNASAAEALSRTLHSYPLKGNAYLLIGLLRDKDVDGFLRPLLPFFHRVVVTKPINSRAMEPVDLEAKILASGGRVSAVYEDIGTAVDNALSLCTKEDLLVIAGSLYMIGHARKRILGSATSSSKKTEA